MFSRKKSEQSEKEINDLSQFGLTDIPDDLDPSFVVCEDANDSDLEAQFGEIIGSKTTLKKKPEQNLVKANDLDKIIADCLKDVSDGEDDESAEDDELLRELQIAMGVEVTKNYKENVLTDADQSVESDNKLEILNKNELSVVDMIKQRIKMYKIALGNAKAVGESAKMRRLNRGQKILNCLLQQSISGMLINPDEIPPAVSTKQLCLENASDLKGCETKTIITPITPCRKAPTNDLEETCAKDEKCIKNKSNGKVTISLTLPLQCNPLVEQMLSRQQEYKAAAIKSKRDGDTALALQYLQIIKQFDVVLKMCENGQEVDLSDMPPPPEHLKQFMKNMLAVNEQQAADAKVPASSFLIETGRVEQSMNLNETDILIALQQRLNKYKSVEESAKAEENASKVRRFGRIVKQYEEAIKSYKAGRTVAYEELPVPPGFEQLHVKNNIEQKPHKVYSVPFSSQILSTSVIPPQPPPTPSLKKSAILPQQDLTQYSAKQQKQMKILFDRQKEFKIAAIEAKRAGEINQAKEYLKIYKGFDAMLNASKNGLPVDLSTLPVPPSERNNLEASFAIITTDDCDPNDDISCIRIEEQLAKQLMMCKNTRDHHKAIGDVAGMNRFENLGLTVQKDLDFVRYSKRKNFPLPKFYYEKRTFNIVHCNTDLTENQLEIIIVRGINYNVPNPKGVDTYVRIEFPLLNDEAFKSKTNLVKDTDSPDYDQHFKIEILRGNRQFQRIFKRHSVKFEVYSRGGFLRSDTLIGAANVKLQPLETKCDIHDTFDLLEGRKMVGGKLEIKIRIRNPILTKQIEQINEKWLVIDT